MNSNDMMMRDEWFMMPFGGLIGILVFIFLLCPTGVVHR